MAEDFTDEFADADLKDLRRNRRLGKVVAAMAKAPAASISAAGGGWGETMGALRLLNCGAVTPGALLAPHRQAVAERCAGHACVVVSQDTTEFDYSRMTEMTGRGPLNSEGSRAEWIIRANQDRALAGVADGEASKLFAALEAAPVLGEIEFAVCARKGSKKVKGNRVATFRSARTVRQVVRAMKITPRSPGRKGGKLPEVSFWAVLAEETDPPAGEEPLRWLLLTSKEVKTLEDARRIINLYLRRWDIEVFHRVLKTGCRVERIQLKSGQAVVNALMIYAVTAWRILYLTNLGRQCPHLPCGCVFEEAEWKGACAVVKRKPDAGEPSLSEFIGIVGKLGGHLGRKGDGPPGPQSVWQGLTRVRDFALAWQACHGG